jgi:hypothetical protein
MYSLGVSPSPLKNLDVRQGEKKRARAHTHTHTNHIKFFSGVPFTPLDVTSNTGILPVHIHFRRFRKIAKKTIKCVKGVRPSARNWAPTGGILQNFIFVYFSKIRRENSSFIKIWQE